MALLPSLVKGMRDYSTLQVQRRNYMLSVIQSIYECYGFEPLETPALESRATLIGKYGQEGEQLMFNILKSGNFLEGIETSATDYKKLKPLISDKGLRYDLTVPLMRYIATHQHALCFPFRRYQIQPVWRADRPQKGRYREFLQCDADIIGSNALLCEAEILKLIYDVCTKLGIRDFCIKINHRGVLSAIADPEKEKVFCTIVDKLDKIGCKEVIAALAAAGFSSATVASLTLLQKFKGNNNELLAQLATTIGHTDAGAKAIEALKSIQTQAHALGLPDGICCIEPTLARGLAYYTGLVMELTVAGTPLGSLGGGGRYENLGDLFGTTGLVGVGFSFGIDRLYDLMEAQNLFEPIATYTIEVLLVNIEAKVEPQLLYLLNQLRLDGFKAALYPERVKIKKQLAYADKKNIPFVIILGETESAMNHYTLKNMETGVQAHYSWPELCAALRSALTC
ncbi:MAG: histidine--tRNA ligase [Candidatus Cardinium sp.]|uniref:histidine--tRNA ligase n=1 Tax=Cardinium endosymbiont of Dermatophagoides farinae TaxID=2597823 RepID=UPI001183030D|nr:histidine--tRNA ligase [Cardinium endosymbiont of Dermatophagoides farinae]TSJ80548.1 histidine--tRNA ligase [Cardinium endosymbiont of Dermatophagoides farinae]UWW96520.1 MAG: histidine--tRNA ligase [Candidatus Cardinium sp.]